MAIDNALVYLLFELPTLAISRVLRKRFSMTPERAYTVACVVLVLLVTALCFAAWFLYLGRPP